MAKDWFSDILRKHRIEKMENAVEQEEREFKELLAPYRGKPWEEIPPDVLKKAEVCIAAAATYEFLITAEENGFLRK